MWGKTHSQKVTGLSTDRLWQVWSDVNQWHTWQDDIDYAKLEGEFTAGQKFLFKPKGSSEITLELINVEPGRLFVDLTRFPLAKMYGAHEFIDYGHEVEVKITISIEGVLSLLWRKLVAEDIVKGLSEQTTKLIERAQNV